jgi:hypothetical protein
MRPHFPLFFCLQHKIDALYFSFLIFFSCCCCTVRKEEQTWTADTYAPYDDGHQWRKYGEKKLSNSNFPRSASWLPPPSLHAAVRFTYIPPTLHVFLYFCFHA